MRGRDVLCMRPDAQNTPRFGVRTPCRRNYHDRGKNRRSGYTGCSGHFVDSPGFTSVSLVLRDIGSLQLGAGGGLSATAKTRADRLPMAPTSSSVTKYQVFVGFLRWHLSGCAGGPFSMPRSHRRSGCHLCVETPRLAHGAVEHSAGVGVAHDLLLLGIPADFAF